MLSFVLVSVALVLLLRESVAFSTFLNQWRMVSNDATRDFHLGSRLGVPADVHLEGCCLPGSSPDSWKGVRWKCAHTWRIRKPEFAFDIKQESMI